MLQRQPEDTGQGTVDNVLSLSPRWLLARHIYCTSRTAHKNSKAQLRGRRGLTRYVAALIAPQTVLQIQFLKGCRERIVMGASLYVGSA